jgi:DNA repair exonuclease SbcCD ATPase subunit
MIEKIVISNFEKIESFSANAFKITAIKGQNGVGKTALARAIIWCLTGRDVDGAVSATRCIGSYKSSVTVSVTIDNSTYERTRTKTRSSFTENGEPVPEDTFLRKNNLTPEAFLIIFFPGFFLKMNELKQRDVFTAITPPVDEQALLQSILQGVEFKLLGSVKDAHKIWNDNKIHLEKNFAAQTAKLAALNVNNVPDDAEKQINDLSEKIISSRLKQAELSKLIKQYQSEKTTYDAWMNQNLNLSTLLKHREQVIAQNAKNAELRKQQENEPAMRLHLQELEANLSKADAQLKELISKGQTQKILLQSLEKAICPTCSQTFPVNPDDVAKAKKEVNSLRAAFAEQQKIRNSIKEERDDLAEAVSVFVPVPADVPVPEIKEIQSVNPPQVSKEQVDEWENNRQVLENEIRKFSSEQATLEAKVQMFAKNKQEFETTSKLVSSTKDELEKATKIAAALHPKTGLPALALKKRMEQVSLEGFDFHFTETLKNGEERECFHILRKDGIPIEYLSSGEQIKFCVALSKLVMVLTKTPFKSIFIEKFDLVDSDFVDDVQLFLEQVSQDKLLSISQGAR